MPRIKTLIAVTALLLLTTLPYSSLATTVINGAGATFPYPLYAQWFKDYAKIDASTAFSYRPVGSGSGIDQLLAGTVDFCGADALPSLKQRGAAPGNILNIPTAIGGVAVIYNVPGIPQGVRLTPATVAGIFRGKITTWNDPRIRDTNRGLKLPAQKIIVVHRSDASGTTSIFTDYLCVVSETWRGEVGRGLSVGWPVGIGRKGNGGVAVEVKKTEYAIGYAELVYALEERLSYASIRNRSGKFIRPDLRTIKNAVSSAAISSSSGHYAPLVNQPGDGSYPIVGFTWILVYQHQKDPVKGKKIKEFLQWALTTGQEAAPFLSYAPLPAGVAKSAMRIVNTIR